MQSYEFFDTGDGCEKLLPRSEVTSSITMHQITLFKHSIELTTEEQDYSIGAYSLALPLSYIDPFFNQIEAIQSEDHGAFSLILSSTGAFLPGAHDKTDLLLYNRRPEEIRVNNFDQVKEGKVSVGERILELTSDMVQRFAESGETFVRLADTGKVVKLALNAEEIIVEDLVSFLKDREILYRNETASVNLNEENLTALLQKGRTLATIGNVHVRLRLPEQPAVKPPSVARSRASQIATSGLAGMILDPSTGDVDLNTIPEPATLSPEDYCLVLGILLEDSRFESLYDYKLGKHQFTSDNPTDTQTEFRNILQTYTRYILYELCMIKRNGIAWLYDVFGKVKLESVPIDPSMLDDALYCQVLEALETNHNFLYRKNQYLQYGYLPGGGNLSNILATAYLRDERLHSCDDDVTTPPIDQSDSDPSQPMPDSEASKPEPILYQIGLATKYQQKWDLLGYSRGALLSSITLAPREEAQIEIFTWDKFKIEEEQKYGYEYESNREITTTGRASANIVHQLKETLNAKAGLNGEIKIPIEDYVDIGVGGDGSISNQVEDGITSTVERINEVTHTVAEKYKATHQVKIVQTHEFGEERRTIRKLQNPNSSLTLSLHHFEILENYRVTSKVLESKQFCVLVENPTLPEFDIDFVRANEHVLQRALLSANYRDGFKAAQTLAGQRWFENSHYSYLNRLPQTGSNSENGSGTGPESSGPRGGIYDTARSLQDILLEFLNLDLQQTFQDLWTHHDPTNNTKVLVSKLRTAEQNVRVLSFWEKFKSIYPGIERKAEDYVRNVSTLLDQPNSESEIIRQVSLLVDGIDDEWLYNLKMIAASVITYVIIGQSVNILLLPVIMVAPFTAIIFPVIHDLVVRHDDKGLPAVIKKAKRQLVSAEASLEAATLTVVSPGQEAVANEAATLLPEASQIPQVYSFQELAQAQADFEKLSLHLEANRVYYQNEIWQAEDPNQRFMRLESMGLAPFVTNRLLGFAGTKALYPLRFKSLPQTVQETLELHFSHVDLDNIEPKEKVQLLSLPNSGVHMEAIVGKCESLEPYLQDRRSIDLQSRQAAVAMAENQALQAKLETDRLQKRLEQDPPLLDYPLKSSSSTNLAPVDNDAEDDLIIE